MSWALLILAGAAEVAVVDTIERDFETSQYVALAPLFVWFWRLPMEKRRPELGGPGVRLLHTADMGVDLAAWSMLSVIAVDEFGLMSSIRIVATGGGVSTWLLMGGWTELGVPGGCSPIGFTASES